MLYKHNNIVNQLSRIFFFFAYNFLACLSAGESSVFNTELMSNPLSLLRSSRGGKIIVSVDAGKTYRHILKYMSWPYIVRVKKHMSVDHCRDIPNKAGRA